jgi:Mrp family chromosome partitioning ATPase
VDEEWRNLTLEEGAPGSAFVSAAATPSMHPVVTGKLRNAGLLVFAGLFFAMLAAVVAHKMDPRVYIASDVERVLGYTPMAQLPDFYEVPVGVSEEHMLRLAASIEHARKQGNLKSCIFTGTGPGTGVTTVAGKVRDLLEAMGRPTMLVDATGATATVEPASTAGDGLPGMQALVAQRGSRPSALLQQMADESKIPGESLVLTDTAPLVLSAETEYLARFVDCAIVVVQSGVTTRTQLRDAAATLQRLDVAAVGFVLNRVGLEKADPAFRLSVKAIEQHLDNQSSSMARRGARNRALTPEPEEEFYSREAAALPEHAAVASEPASAPAARLAPPPIPQAAALPQFAAVVPQPTPMPAARFVPQAIPQAAALPQYAAVVPEFAPAPRLAAAAIPLAAAPLPAPAVSEVVAPRATPAVPDLKKLPAQKPQRELWTQRAQEALQPMTNQNSNLPWWLADLYPQPDESNPAAQPDPATAQGAQAIATELRPAGVASIPRPAPPPVQSWDRLPRVPAAAAAVSSHGRKPAVAVSAAADSFVAYQPAVPIDRSLSVGWKPAAVSEEFREVEPEENASGLATRLSGLRSLFSVLGVKDQPKAAEPAAKEAEVARPFEPANNRTDYTKGMALTPALATPIGSGAVNASPKLVTATPEFLPPRPTVEEAENSKPSRFKNRRDRADDFDDVQILPSWRGQYRK